MKKFVIIILLLSIIGGGVYYFKFLKKSKDEKIEFIVPEDAFLFFQSDDAIAWYNRIDSSSLDVFLSSFQSFKAKKTAFENILELIPESRIRMNISAHKTSKTDFDLIYYFDENQGNVIDLIDIISKKEKWKKDERKLDGFSILEFTQKGKTVLNYYERNNWLIVSKNPFLIEETVKNEYVFEEFENEKLTIIPLNFKDFISDFINNKKLVTTLGLEDNRIVFEFDQEGNKLNLTGASTTTRVSEAEANSLKGLFGSVPLSTDVIIQNNDEIDLGNGVYLSKNDGKNEFGDTLFTDFSSFPFAEDRNESVCKLSENLILRSKTKEEIINSLNSIEEENTWGKSLSLQTNLKNVVDDAEKGVLVKDVGINKLTDLLKNDVKKELGASVKNFRQFDFISLQKSKNGNEAYYEWFFNFKDSDDEKLNPNVEGDLALNENIVYQHDSPFILKPYVVKNHNSGDKEIISQDSLLNLCLIDLNGKLLWVKPIEGRIKSDIKQVDLFRNGKLQYAFITQNKLHIVDRNGDDVEGYPIKFEKEIDFLSIFDYDKNKKYRFLITSGPNLILQDSKGNQLEPWIPLTMESKVDSKPEHYRIGTKDVILFTTDDNKVHLLNRRGEEYRGFPFLANLPDIKYSIVDKKGSFSKTTIKLFDQNGNSETINLNAEILDSEKPTKLLGKRQLYFDNREYISLQYGEFSSLIYNSELDKIHEVFEEVNGVQYYYFNSNNKYTFVNHKGTVDMLQNKDVLGEFKSTQPVSLLYSASKNEIAVYLFDMGKLSKIIIQI